MSLAQRNKKKGGDKAAVSDKYLKASEWNALSPEAHQAKIIEARKKSKANDDDKSTKSTSTNKSIKSLSVRISVMDISMMVT